MSSIGLFDHSAIYWTGWHATKDQDLSAAYDYTRNLVFGHAERFDYVAICLDSPRSFRREMFAEYKAQREEKPVAAIAQLRRTVEELEKHFHVFQADGMEGDDVIATLVRWADHEDIADEITIVGADKDMYALLGPRIWMLNHQTGKLFGVNDLWEKLAILPSQVPDYLALVGDSSDNLPGVKGVGPKKAAQLLQAFHDLDGIYKALHEQASKFTPALATNLRECEADARRTKVLATLRTDAPINCPLLLDRKEPPASGPTSIAAAPVPDEEDEEMGDTNERPSVQEAEWTETKQEQQTMAEPAKKEAQQQESGEPARAKALAVVEQPFAITLEPRNLKQAWWLAEQVAQSRLFYRKFDSPSAALVAMMAGREMGLGVVSSMLNVHVIEGSPSYHAHLIIAKAMQHPDCEYFHLVESTNEKATYVTKRRNDPGPTPLTYTMEDAELAGLTKPSRNGKPSNWLRIPREMLRKQAGVELARAVYPDATRGMYTPEERDPSAVVDAEYEVA